MEQNEGQQASNPRSNNIDTSAISDPPSEQPPDTGIPYSIFKPCEKKVIVFTAALTAVFSPMSTTIYLPALNQLAEDLHVSPSEINLTITTFLVSSPLRQTIRRF